MFLYYLPFILMPFILATGMTLNLLASGTRNELEEKAPDYAYGLYRSSTRQFLYRVYPVRGFVLFFKPVPSVVKGTVAILRLVFIFHLGLLSVFSILSMGM